MKKAKLTYDVWIGFRNYRGEINDISRIASFCSHERAMDYIAHVYKEDPPERKDDLVYGIYVMDEPLEISRHTAECYARMGVIV